MEITRTRFAAAAPQWGSQSWLQAVFRRPGPDESGLQARLPASQSGLPYPILAISSLILSLSSLAGLSFRASCNCFKAAGLSPFWKSAMPRWNRYVEACGSLFTSSQIGRAHV